MKNTIKNTLKILAAGAVVFGIGWAFLTLQPVQTDDNLSVDVKDSTADILTMSFAEQSRTQKFSEALNRLGHEEPRVYDYNGTAMFFSTNVVRETPREVVEMYQRQFVDQGINETVHLTSANEIAHRQRGNIGMLKDAAEKQEIVPYTISDDHVAMGGAQFERAKPKWGDEEETLADRLEILQEDNDKMRKAIIACGAESRIGEQHQPSYWAKALAQNSKKITKAAEKQGSCTNSDSYSCSQVKNDYQNANKEFRKLREFIAADNELKFCPAIRNVSRAENQRKLETFESKIKSFQSIEAFRMEGDAYTTVTAVWSSEALDLKRIRTGHYGFPKDKDEDATLPLCDNCRRSWVYKGTGKEQHLSTDMVLSPNGPSLVADFYRNDLPRKGWKQSEATPAIQELQRLHNGKELNARWLHFARGDEILTVRIREHDNGSKVTAYKTD